MKYTCLSQSPGRFKLLVTLTALAFAFLFALLIDRLPGAMDQSVPGALELAQAEETEKPEASSEKEEEPKHQVTVYVTSWCPACRMTTDYLKKKNIPYVVKDVERNEQYMKEMVKKVGGYRGVPSWISTAGSCWASIPKSWTNSQSDPVVSLVSRARARARARERLSGPLTHHTSAD